MSLRTPGTLLKKKKLCFFHGFLVNILGVRLKKKKIVVSNIHIKMCFKTPGTFFKKKHFWSLSEFGLYAYISETVHLSKKKMVWVHQVAPYANHMPKL